MYKQEEDSAATNTREGTDLHLRCHEKSTIKVSSKEVAEHGNVIEPTYAENKEVKLRRLVKSTKR